MGWLHVLPWASEHTNLLLLLLLGLVVHTILMVVGVRFLTRGNNKPVTISRLLIYPVKGCRPLEAREWKLSRTGVTSRFVCCVCLSLTFFFRFRFAAR